MCRVLVVGAGGVGVYFSGRLAQAGAEVTVVARSDYEVASRSGYEIQSIAGDFHFTPAAVLKHAADYEGEADYVILTAKVLPDADAVELLRPAVRSPKSVIVLIQNGIDIERKVRLASAARFRSAPGQRRSEDGELSLRNRGGGPAACRPF